MKKYKKNLSFLLAFVMALSLMPGMRLTAQADGNVASVTKGSETTNYASFNEAVTEWASTSGATLKLLADVTKDSTITISAGTESSPVILDLNGYGILSTSSSSVISVGDGNYFTLKDTGSDSTTHYITLTEGKGTAVSTTAPSGTEGTGYIAVTGGYITGGVSGGIINSGYFTMEDGTICGNTGNGVYNSLNFTMEDGTICRNTVTSGGGVLNTQGTFTMSGGKISENTASTSGGGVYNSSGTFTMSGGEISGNTVDTTGGGVQNNGTFTISGGKISGNSAVNGAGVNNYTTFEMSGGEISNNTASTSGGGVYNIKTFTMSGGKISENTASTSGGGIYNNSISNVNGYSGNGVCTISGGEISGNTATSEGNAFYNKDGASVTFSYAPLVSTGTTSTDATTVDASTAATNINSYGYIKIVMVASVTVGSTTTEYVSFDSAVSEWASTSGATLKLLDDVTVSSNIAITGGTASAPITLDLNGYGILSTSSSTYGLGVIWVKGDNYFILKDTGSDSRTHYITLSDDRGTAVSDTAPNSTLGTNYIAVTGGYITGGISRGILNYGYFTMEGGTICGNTSTYNGGAILSSKSFTMNGGEISYNSATSNDNGGGVYVAEGVFTMNGGKICHNTSSYYGGGVFADQCTFTMNGGEISSNTSSLQGGGVCNDRGTFNMSAGVISGNSASGATAVYCIDGSSVTATVNFTGTVTAGAASDSAESVSASDAANTDNLFGYNYIKVTAVSSGGSSSSSGGSSSSSGGSSSSSGGSSSSSGGSSSSSGSSSGGSSSSSNENETEKAETEHEDGSKTTTEKTVSTEGDKTVTTEVKTEVNAEGDVTSVTTTETIESEEGKTVTETVKEDSKTTVTETVENEDGSGTVEVKVTKDSGAVKTSSIVTDETGKTTNVSVATENGVGGEKTVDYAVKSDGSLQVTDVDTNVKTLKITGTVTGADGNTYEVTSITKGAVAGESSITTVVVGDGITAIGKGAFKNCDSLTKVAIGDDVTSILKDAFRGDSNLTRVYINSAALEKIGSYAFGGISKSAVIKVTGTKSQYSRTYKLIEKSHINASVKVKRHA